MDPLESVGDGLSIEGRGRILQSFFEVVMVPRFIQRAGGSARRHPWLVAGLAVCFIGIVVGGSYLWGAHQFRAAERALNEEKLDEAREHIASCLRIWYQAPTAYLLAARIERVGGNYPLAERYLSQCIRLQRGASEQTQLEQILLRAQSGEFAEVEKGLWECVNTNHPDSPRILETLTRVYVSEARFGGAVTCLTIWLEREPTAVRAWHWRGWAYENLMQLDKAISDYEKTLELDPERWGARTHLTRLLLQMNDVESARLQLDQLLTRHRDDPDVQLLEAQTLRLEGKTDEAAHILDRILEAHPRHFAALYFYSKMICEQESPQYDRAERLLRRALAINPTDYSTLHALYKCLENQGKEQETNEIRRLLDRVQSDLSRLDQLRFKGAEPTPNDPQLLCEMGVLLMRVGSMEAGLIWLNRALQSDPNHVQTHEALLRHYESIDRKAEAELHRQHLARLSRASSPSPHQK